MPVTMGTHRADSPWCSVPLPVPPHGARPWGDTRRRHHTAPAIGPPEGPQSGEEAGSEVKPLGVVETEEEEGVRRLGRLLICVYTCIYVCIRVYRRVYIHVCMSV